MNKIIGSGIVTLLILLAGCTKELTTGISILEPNYKCASKESQYCFEVRDYGTLINYRCLYNETNLRKFWSCPEGWIKIEQIPIIIPKINKINVKQEICHPPPIYRCIEK